LTDVPLGESLSAVSRFFVGDLTVEEALHRIARLAVDAVPGADLVGLTIMVEGRQRTAVFTDDAAPEIDQAQYETGEGPCLDAFLQQRIFTIESTREAGPWPTFRRAAAAHGVGSTLSLPLLANDKALGAMNVYAFKERAFGEHDVEVGTLFSYQAASVLANAQAYWDARDLSSRLGEAMEHRAIIEQAKGMLMATQPCAAEEAFDILVRASQRENVKLRDIAARMVGDAERRAAQQRASGRQGET